MGPEWVNSQRVILMRQHISKECGTRLLLKVAKWEEVTLPKLKKQLVRMFHRPLRECTKTFRPPKTKMKNCGDVLNFIIKTQEEIHDRVGPMMSESDKEYWVIDVCKGLIPEKYRWYFSKPRLDVIINKLTSDSMLNEDEESSSDEERKPDSPKETTVRRKEATNPPPSGGIVASVQPVVTENNTKSCFRCGKTGHIKRNCSVGPTCFTCKKPGHVSRDCRSARRRGNENFRKNYKPRQWPQLPATGQYQQQPPPPPQYQQYQQYQPPSTYPPAPWPQPMYAPWPLPYQPMQPQTYPQAPKQPSQNWTAGDNNQALGFTNQTPAICGPPQGRK